MGLKDLIDTEAARRAEYGRRKRYYTEKTIHPKLREEHEGEGWIHVKDLQSGAKMRKAKSHDELLENRVWCIGTLKTPFRLTLYNPFQHVLLRYRNCAAFWSEDLNLLLRMS